MGKNNPLNSFRREMRNIELSEKSVLLLTEKMKGQINNANGRKALEFGSGSFSLAGILRGELEYLGCTDKSVQILESITATAESNDIHLIPDSELSEDCYFGRFHLVYTLFGFHGLPHLVDEIMRLRRLILKGGRMVIIDSAENNFEADCIKQLKRCGFVNIETESFDCDGRSVFLISAQK